MKILRHGNFKKTTTTIIAVVWLLTSSSAIHGSEFGTPSGGFRHVAFDPFQDATNNRPPPDGPDGFRDVKWGQNIHDIPNMSLYRGSRDDVRAYIRESDKMAIGDAQLTDILYVTYPNMNTVMGVMIYAKNRNNYNLLCLTLENAYGEPSKVSSAFYKGWIFKNVFISCQYNRVSDSCILIYRTMEYIDMLNDQGARGIDDL